MNASRPGPAQSLGTRAAGRRSLAWALLAGLVVLGAAGSIPAAEESRVIYMVIQADPETTMGEVKAKFELARDATKGCNVREVLIEPIDPQTYTTLRSILRRGLDGAQEERGAAADELIKPMVGVDSGWSIDLGSPFEFIESVAVQLAARPGRSDGGPAVVQVTGAGPNPEGYALKLHSPGRYVLTLPKGVTPQSIRFDAVLDDGKAEVRKRVVEQAWPAVGRAYLVTLSDVVGDEALLFESLKDPAKVSNPVREIQDARKASLMVASFVEVLGNRLRIQDGRITFNFVKPQGVKPKRLWLLFPLSAEQLAKEKAALEAVLAEPDGFKRLPQVIRDNARRERLAPGTGANWVELPLVGDGFVGTYELDVAGWRSQLAADPATVGDNALMVYEFENEQGTRMPLKMTEGFVITDRIAEWLPALRAAR